MDYQLYLLCNCCIYLYILLFLLQILTTPCLLLSLFTSLNLCSGKFGTPITDDVSKLTLLKQNIPSDYEIPVSYIPKEVADTCWVVLNIYPLEQSLRKLANMFGTISSNKENIIVFIAMLKSLRFTFDHEELETSMQVFQCHYQEGSLMSGLYFDYIKEVLQAAAQETAANFSCKPPPCLNSQQTPGGLEDTRTSNWTKRMPLLLVLIPFTAAVVLIVWLVKSRRRLPPCSSENSQATPSDMVPSVSVSIPLQTLAHAADTQPAGEAIPEDESG
uniref:Kit ligand n=1 Tax=Cynoglossus semilaevis TaxID=244447 RepID=A0A3P8VQ49_CYNSE